MKYCIPIKHVYVVIAGLALVVGVFNRAFADEPPPLRHIVLTVQVTKPEAVPVPEVAIAAGASLPTGFGLTNAQGSCQISLDVEAACTRVWVEIVRRRPQGDAAEVTLSTAALRQLSEMYATPTLLMVPLVTNQQNYNVQFEAAPAITATVRLTAAGDHALDTAVVRQRGARLPIIPRAETGIAKIAGIKKNSPAVLVIQNTRDGSVREFQLSSTQTAADINVGDISVPVSPPGVATRLRVTGVGNWPRGLIALPHAITIMSTDGESSWSFMFDKDDGVVFLSPVTEGSPPMLPAGQYLVLPGVSGASWPSILVRERLSMVNGLQAIQAAGVPMITVSDGSTVETVISADVMLNACKTLRGF